jgi:Methyltransferase domain
MSHIGLGRILSPSLRYSLRVARTNPWSLVSASEYEAYMGPGALDELAPLSTIFAKVYGARRPRRLAMLGVATGNGLEHVDLHLTGRIVGLDVNLSYLAVARQRLRRLGAALELHCCDVERAPLEAGRFDLVHAGLLLEYVDVRVLVPKVASWLAPGGAFTVVLQLPGGPAASESRYPSVRALAESMRLVPPGEVRDLAGEAGLVEQRAFVVPLATGRRYFAALYEKAPLAGETESELARAVARMCGEG